MVLACVIYSVKLLLSKNYGLGLVLMGIAVFPALSTFIPTAQMQIWCRFAELIVVLSGVTLLRKGRRGQSYDRPKDRA
jgi:hypothetical protein